MRFAPPSRAWLALSLALVAVAGLPARAAEKTGDPARPPAIDPRADRLLRAMGDYLGAANQLSFRAAIPFEDSLPSGQLVEYSAVQDAAVRRPNRAYVEYEGDLGASQLWYDGKQITVYDGDENVYAAAPMPGNLDAALARLLERHGFTPPLADLVHSDPYRTLREQAQLGAYLGKSVVEGVRCHHLAYIDWQIWIEDGTQIVPCKLVITYTSLPGAPAFRAVLTNWDLGARLADELFVPLIPPSAAKREFHDVSTDVKSR